MNEKKMSKSDLQGLLHMRHRDKTHTPKKGKGSYDRRQNKFVDIDEFDMDEEMMFQELK